MKKPKKIFQIVIEGHKEEQVRDLFEEIQNKYDFFDNCVFQEATEENTIIDDDRRNETGLLWVRGWKKKQK